MHLYLPTVIDREQEIDLYAVQILNKIGIWQGHDCTMSLRPRENIEINMNTSQLNAN